MQFHCGDGTVGGGGDDLTQVLDAQVTGRVHARHRGLEVSARDHVAVVVQFDDTAHELGGRHVSGEHEDTKRAVVGWLPRFRLTGSAVEDRRLA